VRRSRLGLGCLVRDVLDAGRDLGERVGKPDRIAADLTTELVGFIFARA
jgi:hypothetical protein